MIVTEEEAKTKRCQEGFGIIKEPREYAIPKCCIGSACMAWRWKVPGDVDRTKGDDRGLGYCGKAGRP